MHRNLVVSVLVGSLMIGAALISVIVAMTTTASSPKTALLVIDVQPEWYSQSHVSQLFPGLAANMTRLLEISRNHSSQIEVVHIRAHYSYNNTDIDGLDLAKWMKSFKELNPEKPVEIDGTHSVEPFAAEVGDEKLFMKATFDGFLGTGLHEYLRGKGVERLLLSGLITSVCVQATACGGFTRGYRLELVSDCCGDRSLERHQMATALYGDYMYKLTTVKELEMELNKA